MEEKVSNKSWLTTLLLCWFLGFLGIHRIYAGKIGSGFLMMYGTICAAAITLTNVWFGALAFVLVAYFVACDFLMISFKVFPDCRGEYITEDNVAK